MDANPRAIRELQRQYEKVRKIVDDSPIASSLSLIQDELALCMGSLSSQSRSLLLLAKSEDEISLLRNLLEVNQIDQFQLALEPNDACTSTQKSYSEITLSFQGTQGQLLTKTIDPKPGASFVIGRNEQQSSVVVDRDLTLISGVHAELRFGSHSELSIRDLGSLNGTFVNQLKCKPSQWIEISCADKVIFGAQHEQPGTASLILKSDEKHVPSESHESPYSVAVTTGLLLLSDDDLESCAQSVKAALLASSASTLIVVLDRSSTKASDKDLARLGAKLSRIGDSVHFFPIFLSPLIPDGDSTLLIPEAQPEYESFLAQIKSSHDETFFLSSLARSLSKVVSQVRQQYESAIKAHTEEQSPDSGVSNELPSKRSGGSSSSTVSSDLITRYDTLIQILKNSLADKKAEFLDDYSPNSLTRSLEKELSDLSQSRVRKEDMVRIALQPPITHQGSESLHEYMLSYCHQLLGEWSQSVLDVVLDGTVDGDSISKLYLEASHKEQESDKVTTYSQSATRPDIRLDINSILTAEIAPPVTFTLIRFPGFLGYIFKNLRGQIMSIGGTIVIVGGMLTPQIRDSLKETVLPALLPVIGVLTWLAYRRELNQKSQDSLEKLKKDVRSYYVVYIKNRLEKVTTGLLDLLMRDREKFKIRLAAPVKKVVPENEQGKVVQPSDDSGNPPIELNRASLSKMTRQIDALAKINDDLEKSSKS